MDAPYDVTFGDGKYRLVWDPGKKIEAYRHGERWPVKEQALIGDGMVLALVTDLVEARAALDKVHTQLNRTIN